MQDFQDLFNKAVKIKNADMISRRKEFEARPLFVKAGLYYWPKFEAVRQHQFHQKYFSAELMKYKGNTYFKSGEFDKAVKEYEQALTIFRYVKNKNKNWRKEGIKDEDLVYIDETGSSSGEKKMILQLKLIIYHNLAAGYLRVRQFSTAISSCDEALAIDPNSTKALFRRAKALYLDNQSSIEEYKRALLDLKKALEIEPKDAEIQDLMIKINQDIQSMKKNVSGNLKNMFQKKDNNSVQKAEKNQETQQKNTSEQDPTSRLNAVRAKLKQKQLEQERLKEQKQKEQNGKQQQQQQQKSQEKSKNQKPQTPPQNSQKQPKQQQQQLQQQEQKQSKEEKRQQKIDKMNKENENVKNFWKMFNIEKDYDNFDYDLSYHTDPKAKIPREIEELGKFINTKGQEMVRIFESAGKVKEARDLSDRLKKAKAAKKQLEKISRLDFNRPTDKLIEIAQKYGINIYDDAIKNEFKNIQKQNLKDIRAWLAANDQPIDEDSEEEPEQDQDDQQQQDEEEEEHSEKEEEQESEEEEQEVVQEQPKKQKKKKNKSQAQKRKNLRNNLDSDESDEKPIAKQQQPKQRMAQSAQQKRNRSEVKVNEYEKFAKPQMRSKSKQTEVDLDSSICNYKDFLQKNKSHIKEDDSDQGEQILENVNRKNSYSDDDDDEDNTKFKFTERKKSKLRSKTSAKADESFKKNKLANNRTKSSQKNNFDNDSDEIQDNNNIGNDSDELEDARNYNKNKKGVMSKKKKQLQQMDQDEQEEEEESQVKKRNISQISKKSKLSKKDKYSKNIEKIESENESDSEEEQDKVDNIRTSNKKKKRGGKYSDQEDQDEEEDKKSTISKKSNFSRKSKTHTSQALAIPGKKYKEHDMEEEIKKKGKKEDEKKDENEDPYKPTPYAPFGLNKEGRPITSVDDPDFNMSYYHPDMETNYCNPNNDPNVQMSKNNKHNNLIEDFTTRGKYNKLDYDNEQFRLQNLRQSLQTKTIVQQQNDDLIEVKDDDEDQGMWGQLLIFISIGFFIITIIYHFFNSRDMDVTPEETIEILENTVTGFSSSGGGGGMGSRGMGSSIEDVILDEDLQL